MPLWVHVNNKTKLEVLGGVKTRLKVKHIIKTRREVHSSRTVGENKCQDNVRSAQQCQ